MEEFEIDIVETKCHTNGAKIKAIGVGGGGGAHRCTGRDGSPPTGGRVRAGARGVATGPAGTASAATSPAARSVRGIEPRRRPDAPAVLRVHRPELASSPRSVRRIRSASSPCSPACRAAW